MNRHPESSNRRSVLYVEDNPVNAMLMAAMFERRPDLQLVTAPTGQQAVCIATGLSPSLLLLDLRLPDCHGSQLLPVLRLLPGCEDAPAVAVTADSGFDISGTGFCELWAKPLQIDRVLDRVDSLLAASGASPAPQPPGAAAGAAQGRQLSWH